MMVRSGQLSGLWDTGFYVEPILQYLGIENAPTISTPPSPAYAAPIAPQTGSAMVTWNPDQQNEAYAQRGVQYTADTNYFKGLLAEKSPGGTAAPGLPPIPTKDNTFTWVLAGVAGVLLLVALKGR